MVLWQTVFAALAQAVPVVNEAVRPSLGEHALHESGATVSVEVAPRDV